MTIEIFEPGSGFLDQDALALLATGRGSLAFLLGSERTRFKLFSERINWDRVLLAKLDGKTVGFLAFQCAGTGPYSPKFRDFVREFGTLSGIFRCVLNSLLDLRTGRYKFYVYGLKVIPEVRRRGIARTLILAAERKAVSLNAARVELEVYDTNLRALAFYQAQGYRIDGQLRLGIMSQLLKFSTVLHLVKSVH